MRELLPLVVLLVVCIVAMFSPDPAVVVVATLFAFVGGVGLVIALRRDVI